MRVSETRHLLMQEWEAWTNSHLVDASEATGRDTLRFFIELQDVASPLLNFSSRGRDKWRVIHDWLLSEGKVRN
jgi:hypothetical protein